MYGCIKVGNSCQRHNKARDITTRFIIMIMAKQLFEIIVIVHELSSIQSVEAVITYGKPSQYTLQSHWNRYYYGGTVIREL